MMNKKGITLIELLITLVISAILVAGVYRTFISQQRTYTVQEQVVDMQQNVRAAINQMIREIRTAGSGNVQMVLPVSFLGGARIFPNVVNQDTPAAGIFTIVSAAIATPATLTAQPGDIVGGKQLGLNQIQVSSLSEFDTVNKRYISIGGRESYIITGIPDIPNRVLNLNGNLTTTYKTGGNTLVYPIRAISYQVVPEGGTFILRKDENLGGGRQPLSDNIESIGFQYFDANGNPPVNPPDIRRIQVTVTARTSMSDPEFKGGDGYHRRTIVSNIELRNLRLLD